MTTDDPRIPDLGTALKASLEKWQGPSPRAEQARYRMAAASGGFAPRRRLAAAGLALAMVGVMGGIATAYQGVTLPFTSVHIGGNGSGGTAGDRQPGASQPIAAASAHPTCTLSSALCLSTPDVAHGPGGRRAGAPPRADANPAGGGGSATDTNPPKPASSATPCQPGRGQGDGSGKDHPKNTPPPTCH